MPVRLLTLALLLAATAAEAQKRGGDGRYQVVVNHEEQYSLALAGSEIRRPWRAVGEPGSYAEVRATIEEVWTDMRPRSLRDWDDP